MENNEVVVKQKSNMGLIIILILALLLAGACGYIAYDKFFSNKPVDEEKTIEEKVDYTGFYKGCTEVEGDIECAELVLNEDNTAFLTTNPLSPVSVIGSYSVEDKTLTVSGLYTSAGQTPGIENTSYELKITDNGFIYKYRSIDFVLTKTTEDQLKLYNQMKAPNY